VIWSGLDDLGFVPLSIELLRTEKLFVKLTKKQLRDVDMMRKRHVKDRSALQRQHSAVFDKALAVQDRERIQQSKLVDRASKAKG